MTDDEPTPASGAQLATAPEVISEADVLAFARAFDPQPYHLEHEAANASIFGGLCASGWQICSFMTDRLVAALAADGSAPVQEEVRDLRFCRPVFCGDRIRVEATFEPAAGERLLARTRVVNGDDRPVLTADVVFSRAGLPAGAVRD